MNYNISYAVMSVLGQRQTSGRR